MLQKIFRVTRVLKNTRLVIRKPKHTAVALVHKDGLATLESFVERHEISVLDSSELNLWILIQCLFTRKFDLLGYISTYIKTIKPKLVITFIDNDPNFYLLKAIYPAPKYVSVQNGLRHNYSHKVKGGFFDLLDSAGSIEKLSADLICTFGTASSAMYKQRVQTSCLVTGNLKNNLANFPDTQSDYIYDIVFMSQLAPFDFSNSDQRIYLNDSSVSIQEFYEIESQVAKFLAEYCVMHSLRFAVSGKREAKDSYEANFFSKAIGELPFTFLPKTDSYSSYINALHSQLVIVVDSTIGYELLSRGKRVGFFSARTITENQSQGKYRDTCFGYPNTYPDRGSFWTNSQNPIDYERIIKYLLTISDAEWSKEIEQYTEALMAYRPTNGEFIHMLEQEGIPVRSEVLHRA